MRPMRVMYRLRRDVAEETSLEDVRAYVLLCQDEREEFAVFRGSRDDVSDLFLWGMLHYTIGSPLPELVASVDRVLRPAIAKCALSPEIEYLRPGSLDKRRPTQESDKTWTMDFEIVHGHDRRIALNGTTDALLFMMTASGEHKAFVGGSGTQKSKLIEDGVRCLFGDEVYRDFIRDYRGDESPLMRRVREAAIKQTRRLESAGNGVKVIAIEVPLDEDD